MKKSLFYWIYQKDGFCVDEGLFNDDDYKTCIQKFADYLEIQDLIPSAFKIEIEITNYQG